MIRPIGGYFELELPLFEEYHKDAIHLNSGRFCLEYLLRCRKYTKVYVPYFTCEATIEPIQKLGITYEFYHIDKEYHLNDDIHLADNEALLYINYWGLQNDYCKKIAKQYGNQLILDYTQAFYSRPIEGIDTFNSCRKFFGVPDGGYIYTNAKADFVINQDLSFDRMNSLIKRIDISPEAGYDDYYLTSKVFHEIPIREMSKFTQRMMASINYNNIAIQRKANYSLLQKVLGGRELQYEEVPMIYPYTSDLGQNLRKYLIQNKIFVAKYWPNVEEWAGSDALETWISNHVLPLPIDQRYDEEDMEYIINIIKML